MGWGSLQGDFQRFQVSGYEYLGYLGTSSKEVRDLLAPGSIELI